MVSASESSASEGFTTKPKIEFEGGADHHVGFKASGLGLVKAGGKYGKGLKVSQLSRTLSQPLILANLYPARLVRFDELSAARRKDIAVPAMAGSKEGATCTNVEERFGDHPFYVEIWALPHGSNLVVQDPETVGFWVVAPLEPYDIGLVFRQDSVVLGKGWPDATQMLLTIRVGEPLPVGR